ncbi:hypothetical protein L2E82_22828 [Cichorium intybus]|uniref:Uncharacterized protein n=1 Tax=Cichorium intybus TaxID=13427 RepID=A0ACB9DZU4_CICIN|nr:hypothetical protein L2E82_22828 [Cichorium intybus]
MAWFSNLVVCVYPKNWSNISPLLSSSIADPSGLDGSRLSSGDTAIAPASTDPPPAKGKPHCSISILTQSLNLRFSFKLLILFEFI